jgi:uroporphyrinogen-III synthase
MHYSHILITRPHAEAVELANLLSPLQVEVIILPAYTFSAVKLSADKIIQLREAVAGQHRALLVFTSPRSVEFGLNQVPPEVLARAEIAAIGPATAERLAQAGIGVTLQPRRGYTSEDLLDSIGSESAAPAGVKRRAFILAAPGGRDSLHQGLRERSFEARMLMVYERQHAELAPATVGSIERARSLLVVWTSANVMNALHQRLPAPCWLRVCQGEWLVISDRLRLAAEAFNPGKVHLSSGPTNDDIVAAIRALD